MNTGNTPVKTLCDGAHPICKDYTVSPPENQGRGPLPARRIYWIGARLCLCPIPSKEVSIEHMETKQTTSAACGNGQGSLPGSCGSLAFPYVPMQGTDPVRYSRMEALQTGTLFPGLDLPFKAAIQSKTKLANTAWWN